MKRVFVVIVLAGMGIAAALWFRWPDLVERARLYLETQLVQLVGVPCRIESLTVSLAPLRVSAAGVHIGAEPTLAEVEAVELLLRPLASLAEGRPVFAVHLDAPSVDLRHPLPVRSRVGAQRSGSTATLPAFALRGIEINQAQLRFPMDHDAGQLLISSVRGDLQVESLRGTLAARIQLANIDLQRQNHRVHLDDVQVDGGWDGMALFLNNAAVKGSGITAAASATGRSHVHTATATFDPSLLGVVVDELGLIGGEVQARGTLSGDLANPQAEAEFGIHDAALAGRVLGDLEAHFRRTGATLDFEAVRLRGQAGEATGHVVVTVWKEVPISADLNWSGIDLDRVLKLVGTSVPFATRLDGTTTLRGALDPVGLSIQGDGTARPSTAEATALSAHWSSAVQVHPDGVDMRAEVHEATGNRAAATIAVQRNALIGAASVTVSDLQSANPFLPSPVAALDLTGAGEATVHFSGSTEHPGVAATVSAHDLTVRGIRVPRLHGQLDIARGRLWARPLTIESTRGGLSLTGALALAPSTVNDWRMDVADLDLDLLVPVIQTVAAIRLPLHGGSVSGSIQGTGTWSQLDAVLNLAAYRTHLFWQPVQEIDLRGVARLPQWSGELNVQHTANEMLTIAGEGSGSERIALQIDSTPVDLAKFIGAGKRGLSGILSVHGRIAGPLAHADGAVELTGAGLAMRGHTVGDLSVRAAGERGKWTLNGQGLAGKLTMQAALTTTAPFAYQLSSHWSDDGTAFGAFSPTVSLQSSGRIELSGTLQDLSAATGTAEISQLDFARDAYHLTNAGPIHFAVDRGRITVQSCELTGQGSRLSLRGQMTTAGDLSLEARGAGDLATLELIGPPVAGARGPFSLEATLGHVARGGWQLAGQATAHDASLDLGLPVAFTKLNADLRLTGSSIIIDSLIARAGGGQVTMQGAVDLNHGPALSWTVQDVGFTAARGLEARVAGKGTLRGTWSAPVLDGDVEVVNALYDRNIELGDLLAWLREQLLPGARTIVPESQQLVFNLRIYSRGDVFLDNDIGQVEVWLNLQLTGDVNKPGLIGTIGILDGEVTVRGRKFFVTGGSIDFRDPRRINPVLNLTAESRVTTTDTDYVVTVIVTGTGEQPRVQFSSDDPGLSQNDVLGLVAFGKTSAELQRQGGGAGSMGNLVLLPTGGVQKRFGELVGADSFEITAAQSRDATAIEPRVTVGKDLTDQFRAVVWTQFGIEATRAVQLEYRVTRRFSLLSSWESASSTGAGAFGGDVKFRFDYHRFPFSLLGAPQVLSPQPETR